MRHRSAPHENGGALLKKSARAEAVIFTVEHLERRMPFFASHGPLLFESLDHAFVPTRDERRARRDPLDDAGQFFRECRIGNDAVHEAFLQRLVGPEDTPFIENLERIGGADEALEGIEFRVVHRETKPLYGHAKPTGARGKAQIASRGNLDAATDTEALDGGDRRVKAILDGPYAVVDDFGKSDRLWLAGARLFELSDIGADRKSASAS